ATGLLGGLLNSGLESRRGLCEVLLSQIGLTEDQICHWILGLHREETLRCCYRLVQVLRFYSEVDQRQVCFREVRGQLDRLTERRFGQERLVVFEQRQAQIIVGWCQHGLLLHHASQGRNGVGNLSLRQRQTPLPILPKDFPCATLAQRIDIRGSLVELV